MVAKEESNFRQIEERHSQQNLKPPSFELMHQSLKHNDLSGHYLMDSNKLQQNNNAFSQNNNIFDDVTSIRTDQFKSSA